ncbi:MAG: type IIL restriction-modification enzyme MmeI [Burkholderiaceae bacterium]
MTPSDFIAKWGPGGPAAHLNEEQGAQSHFLDLCELLGVPKPGSDVGGEYVFERRSLVLGESRGYADVFYRDHFAWENKAPGKNLDAALRQLQQYSLALSNPPLLVVCDRLTIRIHTQFNGHPSETHTVRIEQLDQPDKQALLRRLWLAPESFRPRQTSRAITEQAAHSFATLAAQLRARGQPGEVVAHFLTQCLFCFFAEDVGLLPGRMFERLVNNRNLTSERLTQGLASLFTTMQTGGLYGPDDIPWFNGGLFARIDVPPLAITDITELRNAASLNWSAIDVSIFGTLFERGLDPAKRSQLGAHYTDPATIERITGPVITRPLLQKWELTVHDLQALAAKIKKNGDAAYRKTHARFVEWLEELRAFRILDPACGSGNFLFLGLKALKDVELISITQAAALGLDREQDLVTGPHNLLGIELNEYAAELARVSVWIGEIQWRMAHGYPPKTNPVLEPLEQIECRDALWTFLPPPWGEGRGGYGASSSAGLLPPAGEGRDGATAHPHRAASDPAPRPHPNPPRGRE